MQESVSLASFAAAFGAGLVSVLSPCVLPLMPAYLSLLSGVSVEAPPGSVERAALRARVLRACLGFIAGFSLVFVLLGATATRVGRLLRGFEVDVFGAHVSLAQIAGVLIVATKARGSFVALGGTRRGEEQTTNSLVSEGATA